MKRLLCVLLFVAVMVPSVEGRANPYWVTASHGLQVPETMHVQISAMFGGGHYEHTPGSQDVPSLIKSDSGDLQFVTGTQHLVENTGSGLEGVSALQVCDCDVSPGKHTYTFVYTDGTDTFDRLDSVTVTVVSPPPAPRTQAPMPEGDEVNPWDIPSDPWPKGLDCVEWCKNPWEVKPDVAASDAVDSTDAVDGTSSATGTPHGDISGVTGSSNRGCAVDAEAAIPAGSALLLGALVSFLVMMRRRLR